MITVMGATGTIGRQITRQLLAAGEQVRALGRNPERLAEAAAAGAETMAGDAGDAAFLTEAFHGAAAVHTFLPYDPTVPGYLAEQDRLGESIVAAVGGSGVRHVVAISSVGADVPAGTGFITSLHAQEQRLRRLHHAHVLVLRPGFFFENFAAVADVAARYGVYADAVAPDVPLPMIATRDIADVAARALTTRDWSGFTVRELLGPRDLTHAEATGILGAAMGHPDLAYVRLPDPEMIETLVGAGFTEEAAVLHVELGGALSDGTIASREGRTASNTTPTRLDAIAGALVPGHQRA